MFMSKTNVHGDNLREVSLNSKLWTQWLTETTTIEANQYCPTDHLYSQ